MKKILLKYKYGLLLGLPLLALNNARADKDWITSDYKSNIAASIMAPNKISTTDTLAFGFFYTGTNDTYLYFFPNGESRRESHGYTYTQRIQYACKLEMVDEKGIALRKKPVALKMESYFTNETNLFYRDDIRRITRGKTLTPYPLTSGSSSAVGSGPFYLVYTPDDLFEISKAGNYTMTLIFQVMKCRTGHDYPLILITLPPLKIPVIKQEDEKPTSQNIQTNSTTK